MLDLGRSGATDPSRVEKLKAIEQLLSSALVLLGQVEIAAWVANDVEDAKAQVEREIDPDA